MLGPPEPVWFRQADALGRNYTSRQSAGKVGGARLGAGPAGGRARGGIVSVARSCICLLEVLAQRASVVFRGSGLEVSVVAAARVGG